MLYTLYSMQLDIIDLIEKNPITKLTSHYNGKLLRKIKENFTESQQKLFVASFYCYMNYDSKLDYVIDFDDVWKYMGYSQKDKAKRLLDKFFVIDIDYKILLPLHGEQKKDVRGGHNKETIMLTLKTFKKFCLKSGTEKADETHEYFLKMEEILQEVINEESQELRVQLIESEKTIEKQKEEAEQQKEKSEKQLENIKEESEKKLKNHKKKSEKQIKNQKEESEKQLENQKKESEEEKNILREKTLLDKFPRNIQCVYYGTVDNKSTKNETLIKFGNSNDVNARVECHKKSYNNFRLINVFKVSNKLHIENAMKQHDVFKKRRRNIQIENVNYTELLAIENLTFEQIDDMIKKIIDENEYNIENYNKLLETNRVLESEKTALLKEIVVLNADKTKLQTKIDEFDPKLSKEEIKIQKYTFSTTSDNGYFLYAFKSKENRFRVGICRPADLDNRCNTYKGIDVAGDMSVSVKVYNPFTEKIALFLLRHHLLRINTDTYEGDLNDIKLIFNIVAKNEEKLTMKNMSLEDILSSFSNQMMVENETKTESDPEVPTQRKAKRAVDQIDVDSGAIIASFDSIEAAGRSIGCTGSAVGIALRNKTLVRGFIVRYSGISKEDQYSEQKITKTCCQTGVSIIFPTIADAARDAKISAPGLRNRILTKVHFDNHHWNFDKSSNHYT